MTRDAGRWPRRSKRCSRTRRRPSATCAVKARSRSSSSRRTQRSPKTISSTAWRCSRRSSTIIPRRSMRSPRPRKKRSSSAESSSPLNKTPSCLDLSLQPVLPGAELRPDGHAPADDAQTERKKKTQDGDEFDKADDHEPDDDRRRGGRAPGAEGLAQALPTIVKKRPIANNLDRQ